MRKSSNVTSKSSQEGGEEALIVGEAARTETEEEMTRMKAQRRKITMKKGSSGRKSE